MNIKHYSILNPSPFGRQDDFGRPVACAYAQPERAEEGYLTVAEMQELHDQGVIEIHEIRTPDLATAYGRAFVTYSVL